MIFRSVFLYLLFFLYSLIIQPHQSIAQSSLNATDTFQWKHFISMFGHAISADQHRESTIWIASEGGLIRYTGKNNLNYWDSFISKNGLLHSSCHSLAVDEHAIWVGLRSGAARFDILTKQFTPFLNSEDNGSSIYATFILPQAKILWIGTDSGLFLVDKASLKVIKQLTTEDGLSGNSICSILDDNNYVWAISREIGITPEISSSVNGINRIHKQTLDITKFSVPDSIPVGVFRTANSVDDHIWIGSNSGFYTFHKSRHKLESVAGSKINSCHSVTFDDNFVYCINTSGRLYRINSPQKTVVDSLIIPYDWWGAEITSDAQNLYVVRRNRFYKIPKNSFSLEEISTPFLPSTFSRGISSDGQKTYVGSANYLILLDGKSNFFTSKYKMPAEVRQTIIDDQLLWISTTRELRCYNREQMQLKQSFRPASPTIYLTEIDQDYVWIATHCGLYRYHKQTADTVSINFAKEIDSQTCSRITSLVHDNQFIWIAFTSEDTFGDLHTGVVKIKRETVEVLDFLKFPINDYTQEISTLIDLGTYLLASGKCISKISKQTLNLTEFINQKTGKMFWNQNNPYLIWAIVPQGINVFNLLTKEVVMSLDTFKDIYKNESADIYVTDYFAWICSLSGISTLKLSSVPPLSGSGEDSILSNIVSLAQNYPNPFNRATTIEFILYSPQFVTLEIYDITGRQVEQLVAQYLYPNKYFVRWAPKNVTSGVYFYSLKIGNESKAKKFLYAK